MAKKFEPKEIGNKKGLVSNRHVVSLSDGTSSVLYSNPRSVVKGERNEYIREAKVRVLNRLPKQEGQFRKVMLDAIVDVERVLLLADQKRGADGQLRVKNKRDAQKKIRNIVNEKILKVGKLIESNLQAATKTYLIVVNRASGLPSKLTRDQITDVSKTISSSVLREKVNDANTKDRLSVLAKRMYVALEDQVVRSRKEREQGLSVLKKKLMDPKGSQRSCIARGLSRINRTEQNKSMHKATLSVISDLNIDHAYWRLSASHKSYGGSEVCEVLASSSNASNLLPASVSKTGLYRVDAFPEVPHANCMCSIEPLFI